MADPREDTPEDRPPLQLPRIKPSPFVSSSSQEEPEPSDLPEEEQAPPATPSPIRQTPRKKEVPSQAPSPPPTPPPPLPKTAAYHEAVRILSEMPPELTFDQISKVTSRFGSMTIGEEREIKAKFGPKSIPGDTPPPKPPPKIEKPPPVGPKPLEGKPPEESQTEKTPVHLRPLLPGEHRRFDVHQDDDAQRWMKHHFEGRVERLPHEVQNALFAYSNWRGFETINRSLRGWTTEASRFISKEEREDAREWIRGLDKGFASGGIVTPENIWGFRGVSERVYQILRKSIGSEAVDEGFPSVSASELIGLQFTRGSGEGAGGTGFGGALVMVKIPSGTPVLPIIKAGGEEQKELLLSRGKRFRFTHEEDSKTVEHRSGRRLPVILGEFLP